MNRKLLKGFLVLAVAAGGVGTVTSCKDEDFKNDVLLDQLSLQAQVDAIRGVDDEAFKANLEKWLNTWTQNASGYDPEGNVGFSSYDDMVDCAWKMYEIYRDIVENYPNISDTTADYISKLYDWMFNNKITASDWYQLIFDMANKRASSIALSQTYNPVFGSINLPIGLNTTVLATYVVESDNTLDFTFPTEAASRLPEVLTKSDDYMSYLQALNTIKNLNPGMNMGVESLKVTNGLYTVGGNFGNMGAAYVNINPASINYEGSKNVQLVNSLGEVVLDAANGGLEVLQNTDKLSFGYTRDDNNGIYKLNANAAADNKALKVFDIREDGKAYIEDLKNAIKDKSISNIAYLGERLYKTLNNSLDALAVKVWWEEPVVDQVSGEKEVAKDENGNPMKDEDGNPIYVSIQNSVLSSFDIASAVIHPLSYGTDLEAAFGQTGWSEKRLPTFSSIETYLEKIQNKLHFEFDDIEGINSVDFELKFQGDGMIVITDKNTGEEIAYLPYSSEGVMNPDQNSLDALIKAIFDSLNMGLNDEINNSIIAQLNKSIEDINNELDRVAAKLGKINEYIDKIKGNSKLDYADKLVQIYDKFAEKVNAVLSNPNHYLQVAAIYSDGEGHYHHLSTTPYDPVRVEAPNGEYDAIEILATSYTADVVVPSYLKYVAVTEVNGQPATVQQNKDCGEFVNVVLPGQSQRVPVKVSQFKSGDTFTLTYVSVDYSGVCSMQNYYLKIK